MEPKFSHPAAASGEVTTGDDEGRAEQRRSTRDAACQTEDPFLGPQEPRRSCRDAACHTDDQFLGPEQPMPATKRKNLESGEQSTTDPDDPSQKKAKQLGWSGPAGMPPPVPEIQAAVDLVGGSERKEVDKWQWEMAAASGRGECSGASPAAAAARPLPLRCPPFPKNGTRKEVREWNLECRRISWLVAKDPLTELLKNLPTLRAPKDPETADAVASSRDKAMVLSAARSIVSVSSVAFDGKVIFQCTGIVVGVNEANKCARILTCFDILCDTGTILDPKPKLYVRLSNKAVSEGHLLFFNKHYDIALLETMTDLPLVLPSFGTSPDYGQEVFVLARDKESFLLARHGGILWLEEPDYLGRNYHMFLSCDLPAYGDGGSVIDRDGNVLGMAFEKGFSNPAILAISTVLTCIEMWMNFSRIARPVHGLHLRTLELLDVSSKERISDEYSINSGYIVSVVPINSAAERLGIRSGDVIVSFDDLGVHSLPRLEDRLLSLGWEFLQKSFDSRAVVNLKLQVYDLVGCCRRSITLPVKFCDASEEVD